MELLAVWALVGVGGGEGFVEVGFGDADGFGEGFSQSETGGDGGGEGAAGAVGGSGIQARGAVAVKDFLIEKQIQAFRAAEVTAFEEDGAAVFGGKFPGGPFHRGGVGNFRAEQGFGFREVRGDDGGEREEFVAVKCDGVGF